MLLISFYLFTLSSIFSIFAQIPNCYEKATVRDPAFVIPFTISKNGFKCQGETLNQPVIFVGPARNSLELIKVRFEVDEPKAPPQSIQVSASNGRDTQVFSLPQINGKDVDLVGGRVLQPLLDEDFQISQQPNISITLMARSIVSTKFRLDVRAIGRAQYNIELTEKEPKSPSISFKELSPFNYIEHRVTMEKKTLSILRIRVNSSDDVCMRVMIFNETSALHHNDLLAKHEERIGSFTRKFSLDYKALNSEPLIIRYLTDENDDHCETIWESSKKRSKKIEILYEMIDDLSYFRPIFTIFGVSTFLMILPILTVAVPQLARYLTKTGRPQEEVVQEARPVENEMDEGEMLVEWRTTAAVNQRNSSEERVENTSFDSPETLIQMPEYSLIPNEFDLNGSKSKKIRLENFQFAFFLMPIILQMAISYFQQPDFSLDHCYHNFECAKQWGKFLSFNHVISNVGYAFAGVFYLVFVNIRNHSKWREDREHLQVPMGVYQNAHLEWSMGIALICEAMASGVYHICPSKDSYKFDTPFIVIVCVLGMVKLYGSRHGNASNIQAHLFIAIALFIDFCVSQLAEHKWTWPLQAFVLVFFLLLGLFKVYTGKHFLERPIRSNFLRRLCVNFQGRILLVVSSINVLLLVIYFFFHTYLDANKLIVFFVVFNMGLYLGYYLLNKRKNGEKLSKLTKFSLSLAAIFWPFALFAFSREESDWTLSPAKSRELNSECILMDFFDYHDIWHFLSALAAVFSLVSISTIDDPTSAIPRNKMVVF